MVGEFWTYLGPCTDVVENGALNLLLRVIMNALAMLLRFTLLLGFVFTCSACDDAPHRARWFEHLVRGQRYEEALSVYVELSELEKERPSLRYQALRASLGSHGYDLTFIQRLEQLCGLHPRTLWQNRFLEELQPQRWLELGEFARLLSRENDRSRFHRLFVSTRLVSDLIELRNAVNSGDAKSAEDAVDRLRETLEHANSGRESRRGLARLDGPLDELRVLRKELRGLESTASVIAWLDENVALLDGEGQRR